MDAIEPQESIHLEEAAAELETRNDNQQMEQEMEDKYGKHNDRYNLRDRKPRSYEHLHTTISHANYSQYPLKKGLEMFGKKGEEAVQKEMEQLNTMDVPDPKHPSVSSSLKWHANTTETCSSSLEP